MQKYHFRAYDKRVKTLQTPPIEEKQRLLAGIEHVTSAMNRTGIEWYVAGGLCVDLAMPELTRHHADIDISVNRKDLEGLTEKIREHAYIVATRDILTKYGKRYIGIFHESTAADLADCCRHQFLLGPTTNPYTNLIDLKPYDIVPEGTIAYTFKKAVMVSSDRTGNTVRIGKQDVPLENLDIFYQLKMAERNMTGSSKPIIDHDLQMMTLLREAEEKVQEIEDIQLIPQLQ